MKVEFVKELYFRELDGKAQQDARIGIFVAIFSAIGGILVFLVRNITWPAITTLPILSLLFCALSIILYAFGIFNVLRAMVGFRWARLPHPDILLQHYKKLINYYAENPTVAGSAGDDFEGYILRQLTLAATHNGENNIVRSARFYRASRYLVWVVIVAAFSGLCLGIDKLLTIIK
jgi:hypothetical protein